LSKSGTASLYFPVPLCPSTAAWYPLPPDGETLPLALAAEPGSPADVDPITSTPSSSSSSSSLSLSLSSMISGDLIELRFYARLYLALGGRDEADRYDMGAEARSPRGGGVKGGLSFSMACRCFFAEARVSRAGNGQRKFIAPTAGPLPLRACVVAEPEPDSPAPDDAAPAAAAAKPKSSASGSEDCSLSDDKSICLG